MKLYIFILINLFFTNIVFAQTPQELKSWLPEVAGWTIDEKIEIFNPDNLFGRINGAAPLYLENNFQEMTSMEYKKGGDYITIQAYRHATPEDAFGMYASERSSGLEYFPIGGEAQGDDENLYFFAGNMYIKMWGSSNDKVKDILLDIGKKFADKIDANAAYPALLSSFPETDKVPYSQTYVTSSYIGHEFLKSVYTTEYKQGDDVFQVFVVDAGNKDNAKEILNKYFTFSKQTVEPQEDGYIIIKDRYNGDIPVIWKGQYITGVYSDKGKTMKDYFKRETMLGFT
ncbi:MAG: hypothetical protein LIO65_05865, partial [Odoribacter sp.]|nr:hypothetical protein [Odoribacter sp.]